MRRKVSSQIQLVIATLIFLYIFLSIEWRWLDRLYDVAYVPPSLFRPFDSISTEVDGEALIRFRMKQERNKRMARRNLNDMDSIRQLNHETLPTVSYFGTNFALSSMCQGDDAERCVPKLQTDNSRFAVLPSRKLLACLIPKNISTMLQAIICYLFKPKEFVTAGRKIPKEHYDIRFCGDENTFMSHEMEQFAAKNLNLTAAAMMATWRPFTVIRDPIDRFLSGFLDKCVRKRYGKNYCNGCQHNLTCFVEKEYHRMIGARGAEPVEFEDVHFFPQNWRCSFRDYLHRFSFIRYHSNAVDQFIDELLSFFRSNWIAEENIGQIKNDLKSHRTLHTTSTSTARTFFEQRLRSSPFLMEFVLRMFYWDFVLFNFSMPEIRYE